jgi:cation diffusion facilitator family transporter
MAWQSLARLIEPAPIRYDEAITIAVAGLLVNLACAWLLRDSHGHHHHGHEHGHGHGHHRHDINLRAAYLHVVADAATSVLAIVALLGGKYWAWGWLDPVMGLAGAALVSVWAVGLLRESGRALLDAEMDAAVGEEIREVVRDSPIPAEISDLHVWHVGRDKFACILGVTTAGPALPEDFRRQLAVHEELVHVTVEVNPA